LDVLKSDSEATFNGLIKTFESDNVMYEMTQIHQNLKSKEQVFSRIHLDL